MPSPFPGMNPFLEQDDAGHYFHKRIVPAITERLVAQVRPDFVVRITSIRACPILRSKTKIKPGLKP
jgi:hypothetical protein